MFSSEWHKIILESLTMNITNQKRRQIVSEIVAQSCLQNSIQTLLNFFWVDPKKKLEGFVWSFLSITGLRSQRQFAAKRSFLASRPLLHCFSEYPDKSHNFRNFIFMTSSLLVLYYAHGASSLPWVPETFHARFPVPVKS